MRRSVLAATAQRRTGNSQQAERSGADTGDGPQVRAAVGGAAVGLDGALG